MKVLVTGATGLLGRAVMRACLEGGHEVTGTAYSRASPPLLRVDLTDEAAVQALIENERPDVVLHLAAERHPDRVERDPDAARLLNVEAPAWLARACAAQTPPAYLIHVSTDYVFDGRAPPYATTSEPNPLNSYGRSKRMAELAVQEHGRQGYATCVRVPILYGECDSQAESAVNVLLDAIQHHGKRIAMDAHGVRYPTYVGDVARVLLDLASMAVAGDKRMPPTLHYAAREAMTKYDMCLVLSRLWNQVCGAPVSSTEHLDPQFEADPHAATLRPGHCKLDVSETEALGIDISHVPFDEWWHAYLTRLGPPERTEGANATPPASDEGAEADEAEEEEKEGEELEEKENQAEDETEDETTDEAEDRAAAQAMPTPKLADADSAPPTPSSPADDARYGTPTPPEPGSAPPAPAVTFSVRVGDPQRVGDPVTAHVVYAVRVSTNAPWFSRPELSVLRRYSDFRWLHAALVSNCPGAIVPPIPEKVKIGRFAPDLIEFRRCALERALQQMLEHPRLQKDEDLKLFLESHRLAADIHARDIVKGPVITPDHKALFGWRQALNQPRFHDPDDWFQHQLEYLTQFEMRMKEIVTAVSTLAQQRKALAAAQEQLYESLVGVSSSGLSRSVSMCFAALAETKKRSSEASARLAHHEAHVLGLVMYEHERLVGSVRKSFAAREDVWQAWQKAEDELHKLRARHAKRPAQHADTQMQALTQAELASTALRTRFEEVSGLCKSEMQRFEHHKVVEIRAAFEAYVRRFHTLQAEANDEWTHCERVVLRQATKSRVGPPPS
ncbi:Vacuolar protein sorting-associated protein vps5 [Malassezia caprae]|uniref:Vacuolar protein sorting-associated protein vps5 n=1 Tax=Malassezia caprae TaxID=1381934 RepID=A0AAF0IW27_9BASI|nr:Vacuolar protein sorting-associated protein vps5 [Malassezia caprae]